MYSLELSPNYYASSAVVSVMGTAYTFTKGVTDPQHPECQSKNLMLEEHEAASLGDGRFTVKAQAPAPAEESKTDKAAKAKAAKNESEG
jgi:hypothetical protein